MSSDAPSYRYGVPPPPEYPSSQNYIAHMKPPIPQTSYGVPTGPSGFAQSSANQVSYHQDLPSYEPPLQYNRPTYANQHQNYEIQNEPTKVLDSVLNKITKDEGSLTPKQQAMLQALYNIVLVRPQPVVPQTPVVYVVKQPEIQPEIKDDVAYVLLGDHSPVFHHPTTKLYPTWTYGGRPHRPYPRHMPRLPRGWYPKYVRKFITITD